MAREREGAREVGREGDVEVYESSLQLPAVQNTHTML